MSPLPLLLPFAFFFQQAPTYTVAGTLVNSVSGQPLSAAHVRLGNAMEAVTAADGRFRFTGVKQGTYVLSAERLGFVPQSYRARTLYAQFSTGIVVGEGERTEEIQFRMIPSAVIFGTVSDALGEPLARTKVYAMRVLGKGQYRRSAQIVNVSTDDRGEYRIASLAAGSYAIIAGGEGSARPTAAENMAYPETYFPGTANADKAEFLRVEAGKEVRADVTLRPAPVLRILGEGPATMAGKPMLVTLAAPSLLGKATVMRSAVVFDSRFTFTDVPAGRYTIFVTDQQSNRIVGKLRTTAETDPTQVRVDQPLPQVSIRVALRGKPANQTQAVLAGLRSVQLNQTWNAALDSNGFAQVVNATSGRYEVVVNQGGDLPVTSLKVNGVPQPSVLVDIPDTGPVAIEVAADADALNLRGRVVRGDVPQSGIIVMLVQRSGWEQTGSYRFDQSDSNGTFQWARVPRGDYFMFAFEDGDPTDYDDPETIRTLLPIAQPLTVTGETSQKVELKVLSLPVAK